MVKKSVSINLIKTDKDQLTNQVVNWALTIGRVLIIVVEIIALSAFIYRFILDNQLRDINSKIKAEQAYLNTQKQKEITYKNLQDRLFLESSIVNQGSEKMKIFKDVIGLTPPGISFNNFAYTNNQINIQLDTGSVFPLSVFINSLRTYNQTDFISIDMIENRTASAVINVGLTVNLKNKGGISANTGN
jgi:hypothetical protein